MPARARRVPHLVLAAAFVAGLSFVAAARPAQPPGDEPVRFARDVRPILSNRCFTCHGPDEAARKADLRLDTFEDATAERGGYRAVAPGDPDASEVIARVTAHGSSDLMPPERVGAPLSEREVATLRRWIEQGASYEPHWAYVAPRLPELPTVEPERVEGARNEIDLFVRARLASSDLAPRHEAPRATLVRRLCLTLWGLPAPLELVERAIADPRTDWYEHLVDELLASPRHGEHQARQWLDAARYGDTHGLHLDNERAIHPYRDWVIDAFTNNLPYDAFVVEQLAGDLLPEPTQAQLVATGFNRCNPTTAEGGLIDAEYLAKYAWDRVDTTSTVFLGLTMACAKCHDHKFDPFTMRDYYALYSFFDDMEGAASDENIATPAPSMVVPREEDRERLADFDARVAALRAELDGPNEEWDRGEAQWREREGARLAALWRPVAIMHPSAEPPLEWRERADGALEVEGALANFGSYTLPFATAEEVLALRLELLPGEESGRIGRAEHGNIVLSRVLVERFRAGLWEPQPIAAVDATREQPNYEARGVLDDDPASGWALQHFEHEPQALRLVLAEPLTPGEYRMVLQFESEHAQHFPSAVRLAAASDGSVAPLVASAWLVSDVLRASDGAHPFDVDLGPDPGGPDVEVAWHDLALADGAVAEFAGDDAAVYLYRTLTANEAVDVELAFGSDDGLRVWLDGAEVHANDTARAHAPAQDVVRLALARGGHELLCKVVNRSGGFAFSCELRGARGSLPNERIAQLLAAANAGTLGEDEQRELRTHYRSSISPPWAALDAERVALLAEREAFEAQLPRTLISRERMLPVETRILVRGLYDHPGEPVESNVPAAFGSLPADAPKNRLALARWIVSDENPLAARVAVNRVWQQHFGRGLVATPEDFGLQGAWPSHPELLDWLAVRFVEEGWNLAWLHHQILGSATWRQSSDAPAEHWRADPDNVQLARGPRFRVDAEVVRDSALFAAGLLVEKVGGPSVKPYQPDGLWRAVAYPTSNTADYVRGDGEDLYRRSLYTFWKRTSPPASLSLLDAPSREFCIVERERTNTPLQALVLLNDEQFVEAARMFAVRALREAPGDDASRATFLVRTCLARLPREEELAVLLALLEDGRRSFDDERGAALAGVGEAMAPSDVAPAELAAWTLVASTVLNLDEFLNID
jgi:hypothetical protein